MLLNSADISEQIKSRIQGIVETVDVRNQGTVLTVTDGICRVEGLSGAMQGWPTFLQMADMPQMVQEVLARPIGSEN